MDFIYLFFVITIVLALTCVLRFRILGCAVFLVEATEDRIEAQADFISAAVVFTELACAHLDAILYCGHISEFIRRRRIQIETIDAGLEDSFVVILLMNFSAGPEFVHVSHECLSAAE